MKKIILFQLFIFGVKIVSADCADVGMQFFPSTKEISLNSKFIIQGYALSQKTIDSFKNRIIYLESDNGKLIELNLQEILKGQMLLTQAIFYPVIALKPNTHYKLKYSNQTENEVKAMMQYNKLTKEMEQVYWKTTTKKNLDTLNTSLNIKFKRTTVNYYGCGPSAMAIFDVNNQREYEIWYKTEVVEMKTNNKTIFYIKAQNAQLNVGHGMCSGAFTFNKKGLYKVRFKALNTDGKLITATQWHTFKSPFSDNQS